MSTLIIYYSQTGNNAKLATALAQKLNTDCLELKESRKRTVFTTLMDVIFNRVPKIQPFEKSIDQYKYLIFVAPVWFGKIGTPLRVVFNYIKAKDKIISFVSLSAGADGIKPCVENELIKRTATSPKAIINLLISDLLPANPKPNHKMLNEYKISVDEAEMLADKNKEKL